MKKGRYVTIPEAKRLLGKPLHVPGGIHVTGRGGCVTVGTYISRKKGKDYPFYKVTNLWGAKKEIHPSDWDTAIKLAIQNAELFDKQPPEKVLTLTGNDAFVYTQFQEFTTAAKLGMAEILHFLIAIKQQQTTTELDTTMKNINKSLITADKHQENLPELVKTGVTIQEFISGRPDLTLKDVMTSLELLHPLSAVNAADAAIFEEFKEDKEYGLKCESLDQYFVHFNALVKFMKGKPLRYATPKDIRNFIRSKTIKKSTTGKGDKVSPSTHNHIVDVLTNLFNFMLAHGYYSRLLGSPVKVRRISTKGQEPDEAHIFTGAELQLLLDNVPWQVVPALILMAKKGVRPATVMRMTWEDYDREISMLKISKSKNKGRAAYAEFFERDLAMLAPWRHCSGPIAVLPNTLEIIRDTARALGIRQVFHDDFRKSAISYRAAELYAVNPATVQAILTEEFGNSEGVRESFYRVKTVHDQAMIYLAAARTFAPQTITARQARAVRKSYRISAVRVSMAMSEVQLKYTHTTPKSVKKKMKREAYENAMRTLNNDGAFPSFISFEQNSDLDERAIARAEKRAKDEAKKHASDPRAQVLEHLRDEYAHEDEQQSLFAGKEEALLPSILDGCPQIPPANSSENDSSQSATASVSEP